MLGLDDSSDEEEPPQLPKGNSGGLNSLFGLHTAARRRGNDTFQWVKPKKTPGTVAQALVHHSPVHLWRVTTGDYHTVGPAVAALMSTAPLQLVCYDKQKRVLMGIPLNADFKFSLRSAEGQQTYADVVDADGNAWALCFKATDTAAVFALAAHVCKHHAMKPLRADTSFTAYDVRSGTGPPVAKQDTVGVRIKAYAVELQDGHLAPFGPPFEATSSKDIMKITLGQGQALRGLEECISGMSKQGVRVCVFGAATGAAHIGHTLHPAVAADDVVAVLVELVKVRRADGPPRERDDVAAAGADAVPPPSPPTPDSGAAIAGLPPPAPLDVAAAPVLPGPVPVSAPVPPRLSTAEGFAPPVRPPPFAPAFEAPAPGPLLMPPAPDPRAALQSALERMRPPGEPSPPPSAVVPDLQHVARTVDRIWEVVGGWDLHAHFATQTALLRQSLVHAVREAAQSGPVPPSDCPGAAGPGTADPETVAEAQAAAAAAQRLLELRSAELEQACAAQGYAEAEGERRVAAAQQQHRQELAEQKARHKANVQTVAEAEYSRGRAEAEAALREAGTEGMLAIRLQQQEEELEQARAGARQARKEHEAELVLLQELVARHEEAQREAADRERALQQRLRACERGAVSHDVFAARLKRVMNAVYFGMEEALVQPGEAPGDGAAAAESQWVLRLLVRVVKEQTMRALEESLAEEEGAGQDAVDLPPPRVPPVAPAEAGPQGACGKGQGLEKEEEGWD